MKSGFLSGVWLAVAIVGLLVTSPVMAYTEQQARDARDAAQYDADQCQETVYNAGAAQSEALQFGNTVEAEINASSWSSAEKATALAALNALRDELGPDFNNAYYEAQSDSESLEIDLFNVDALLGIEDWYEALVMAQAVSNDAEAINFETAALVALANRVLGDMTELRATIPSGE